VRFTEADGQIFLCFICACLSSHSFPVRRPRNAFRVVSQDRSVFSGWSGSLAFACGDLFQKICHGSIPRPEFTKQCGYAGDPSAADLLGGFDRALRQQVMGLPGVTADHVADFVAAPREGVFYRGGPGIIDRINQIC
jgi:hypothetical protein